MPIYTKTGDEGKTHLIGNVRKSKSDAVFEVLGSLDELNSSMSVMVAFVDLTQEAKDFFLNIQNTLFDAGALLANPKATDKDYEWLKNLTAELEKHIDDMSEKLPPLKNFILPGGSKGAALTHTSRAICRRAERNLVAYLDIIGTKTGRSLAQYLNRLSDFLFTFARHTNLSEGKSDIIWKARSSN